MRLREELPEFPNSAIWLNGAWSKEQLMGEKPVLVYFWSVSCQACKRAPSVINLWKSKYGDRFNVIAVHMPRFQEDANTNIVQSTAAAIGINHSIFLDHDLTISKKFQNQMVPNFYLFDKKGQLRHRQTGEYGWHMLEKRLVLLINER
ncbi:TlpA disulfide reductase family protein [Psychrobacillus sp. FSL K6-1267]|uniref:TlpA disulfide reductase family protein n=1 Tax=Psychrobacillus sp. FSL K6-1267 TaxID=2921543 RepID=UPI0030F92268